MSKTSNASEALVLNKPVVNVNVRGPYLISRAALPLLLKSELKTLITISSVGAHVVSPGKLSTSPHNA